ncbi:hypothetical protein [Actinomycetospora termitidis]|uniref:Uncharacterized protein n=1 Tax=Actinomycetospora termitidis TaxID=3053470 RepID=A0ABT7MHW8_9PSEU|nr:hypothetical protein [Actinomycetospora sp. Odt1-22]MDL5158923.1 hypothetical protein [Actinomycetospora sp. Odt1-22]
MDDDDARVRQTLRRFDPLWLPQELSADTTARLDCLLDFYRREHLAIRSHARSLLGPTTPVEELVTTAMQTLCRHPPTPDGRPWRALDEALRDAAT